MARLLERMEGGRLIKNLQIWIALQSEFSNIIQINSFSVVKLFVLGLVCKEIAELLCLETIFSTFLLSHTSPNKFLRYTTLSVFKSPNFGECRIEQAPGINGLS